MGTAVRVAILGAIMSLSPGVGFGATAPAAAAGAIAVSRSAEGVAVQTRAVSVRDLLDRLRSDAGLQVFAPESERGKDITVAFPTQTHKEAAARIGASLGGLVPLRVTREASEGGLPPPAGVYFLVREGSRRQKMLDAYCMTQATGAHFVLQEALLKEGSALVPEIVAFLGDATRDERQRAHAVFLLGALKDPAAQAPLLAALRNQPDPLPREAAAVALGQMGVPAAVPDLRRSLRDPDLGVALGAAWSLVKFGDRGGVPIALEHIGDRSAAVALRALEVLEETHDMAHLPALDRNLLATRDLVRLRTRMTMESIALAPLSEAGKIAAAERILADPDREFRHYGARILLRLGTPDANETLENIGADEKHPGRSEALEASLRLKEAALPRGSFSIE